jgi:hypothetical protein
MNNYLIILTLQEGFTYVVLQIFKFSVLCFTNTLRTAASCIHTASSTTAPSTTAPSTTAPGTTVPSTTVPSTSPQYNNQEIY